jgi:phosphoglycolate phosphatase
MPIIAGFYNTVPIMLSWPVVTKNIRGQFVIMSSFIMIKLLIFDLDGTLADTGQDITDALNYALEPYGAKNYSIEETKMMVGSGISALLASLLPSEKNSPAAKKDVKERFLDFYSKHLLDNTVAYPHVNDTLEKLNGYTKAILSNKRTGYSKDILQQLDIARYFDIIWGSDSVREKKPSPVPILDLLSKLQIPKENTAMIGDSNFDVEAGRAAGVKVIGVTYGFRPRKYLEDSDVILDSFDELLKVIPEM